MRFKIFHYPPLSLLGSALGFLFFGWNAAEQYLTSFYQETSGQTSTALNALAILYASIIIGNFLGPILVKKLGLKVSLILGFTTYVLLVFGVITKTVLLIYLLSGLLGVGAGVMGIAQIDLMRIVSPQDLRGELTGSINFLRTFGGGLGVLGVSFLLRLLSIEQVYLGLGTVMILGVIVLLFLKEPRKRELKEEKVGQIIRKTFLMFKEKKLLLLIPLSLTNGFLLGLILGAIPATVSKNWGLASVGLVMSLFHFTLSFSGFYSGKLSDRKGRFSILYFSIFLGIVAALLIIGAKSIFFVFLAMILVGFFSATNGVVLSALSLDLFEEKIKEAQSAGGIISTILGIVPAFLLNKYFSTNELLYLAIFLCLLSAVSLRILEVKSSSFQQTAHFRKLFW